MRVRLTPNPLAEGGVFRQKLKLKEGLIEIKGACAENSATLQVWVDTDRPVAHVEINAAKPTSVEVWYESWRAADRPVVGEERRQCFSMYGYNGDVTTFKDTIGYEGDRVVFYHRNRDDQLLFDKLVKLEGLESVKGRLWNWQKGMTFGRLPGRRGAGGLG